MNGLGNDFVVLDQEHSNIQNLYQLARDISDRVHGIGCDQMIMLSKSNISDVRMQVYNQDGSEVHMCGNAIRCVGKHLMQEMDTKQATIEINGQLFMIKKDGEKIAVNMGKPMFDWAEIPLSRQMDVLYMDYRCGSYTNPAAVNVGNPHLVFFIESSVEDIDLVEVGQKIEKDPLFPEGVNITFAEKIGQGAFKLRVWERGVGETAACGSAACATAAIAVKRGLATHNPISILFKYGRLLINILQDGSIEMIGDATIEGKGQFVWNE
jgi:diaminopimelate epimerase